MRCLCFAYRNELHKKHPVVRRYSSSQPRVMSSRRCVSFPRLPFFRLPLPLTSTRRSSAPSLLGGLPVRPHRLPRVLPLSLSLRVVVVAPPPAHPRARPEECRTAATVHQAADTEQQRQTQRQNQRSRQQQDRCRDRRAIRHAICRTAATVHHLNC